MDEIVKRRIAGGQLRNLGKSPFHFQKVGNCLFLSGAAVSYSLSLLHLPPDLTSFPDHLFGRSRLVAPDRRRGRGDRDADTPMGAPTPPPHRVDVHRALGGGSVADLLLWRRWVAGVALLLSSTAMWVLFERAGYNLLSFAANTLFLLVLILFLWAKSAALLNRPLPPLPDLEVSENSVAKAADVMVDWINRGLSIGREITVNRNLKLFFQVAFGLWAISYIGGLFNFLTLVYIGIVLAFSVPFVYDKYQDHINDKLCVTHSVLQKQYKRFDEHILKKIPVPSNKEKKIE